MLYFFAGPCISDEYHCNNNRCIPVALTCNGYNPCGDYSDCKSPITTPSLPTTESSVDEATEPFVEQSSPPTEGCSDCRLPTSKCYLIYMTELFAYCFYLYLLVGLILNGCLEYGSSWQFAGCFWFIGPLRLMYRNNFKYWDG